MEAAGLNSVLGKSRTTITREDSLKTIQIGVVRVHAISLADLLEAFDRIIDQKEKSYACFCEAHLCVRASTNPSVRSAIEKATFVLPDGVATTWGARLLGERFPERLSGPSVMLEVCRDGLTRGYKHFFYGGAEGVPDQLAQRLIERFPGLKVVGTYSPPFRKLAPDEDARIVGMINRCEPDIVWVGLGAPKQEVWAHDHLDSLTAPLILPVGAAFDFHSGNRKWAPLWIRRIGMEWAYRMCTGGRRVFIRNAKNESLFTMIILRQVIRKWTGLEKWRLGRGKCES